MSKPITILGIETSCDETSVAVVRADQNRLEILSNVTASQVPIHRKYGGVVPEVAARNHVVTIIPTIEEALKLAGLTPTSILPLPTAPHLRSLAFGGAGRGRGRKFLPSSTKGGSALARQGRDRDKEGGCTIDVIAVTSGPGLMVALQVGVETAKTLAMLWKKPLLRVNHLAGHIYANCLSTNSRSPISDLRFPILALVVSGGHTELVLMKRHLHFQKIGATVDDAAGEAFDKIGSLLGLPYPAGPEIDRLAKLGNPETVNLPRPMINTPDFNFSFSGLKTAALYTLRGIPQTMSSRTAIRDPVPFVLDRYKQKVDRKTNFAASVQKAIVDVLVAKTLRAAKQYKVKTVLLAGGVAANSELRKTLGEELKKQLPAVSCKLPAVSLTTDNGAMIAAAGYFMYRVKKFTPWQKIKADPNWEL